MTDIPISIAVEDPLSEAILREMLKQTKRPFSIGKCFCRGGYGHLKNLIPGLNQAASGMPYLVLTDLDKAECPLAIISTWLTQPRHPNLIFRIAVKEVEAWLLADREAFAKFLGIAINLIPVDIDGIPDPKQCLINLARKSNKRDLRKGIVPEQNSTAKIGKDYNGQLIPFVRTHWQVATAQLNSPSLQRAMSALITFQPTWEGQEN